MMIKSIVGLALVASLVNGASLYGSGNLDGSPNGPGGNVSIETKVRGFKAVLYLFAPDSWITAWNSVPEDGQECFVEDASDPKNVEIYNSDDTQKIKQQIQSQCQTWATEIGSFIDASEATFKSLPATFIADAKAWGEQAQTLGEQFKQAAVTGGANVQSQLGSGVFKQKIAQFSTVSADFTAKIAAYSAADRQQIADAFPKLKAFISGDNAVKFLTEITALYKTLGAGDLDAKSLKTQAQQLKPTLEAIWKEYKTQNADGLKQAGQLLGKDLTQADAAFGAQAGVAPGPTNFNLGNQAGQAKNGLSEAIAKGQEKVEAGREKFQGWLQKAKENTQEGLNNVKDNVSQGVQEFKQKVNEFKQHNLNGQASVNGNGASAGLNVN